jgi:hypothetical protein
MSLFSQEEMVIKKTYIQDIPLINKGDDYCGLYIIKAKTVGSIVSSEENELVRNNFSVNDILIANFNIKAEEGDKFQVIKPVYDREGKRVKGVFRKVGVIMVVNKKNNKVKIIKLCSDLSIGSLLVPYEEIKPYKGKKIEKKPNIHIDMFKSNGKILFIENDITQGTEGFKIVIQGGENKGLTRGTQIALYQITNNVNNRIYLGNAIIVCSSKDISIAKITYLKDPVYKDNYWALLK